MSFYLAYSFVLFGLFCRFVCPLVLCQWMLASLLNLKLLSLLFFMGQGALLMASYPLISILCAFLYDRYLED